MILEANLVSDDRVSRRNKDAGTTGPTIGSQRPCIGCHYLSSTMRVLCVGS